tara:strand:- start:111 stop:479 length:369 start_codon:yes stop_codon:yes gene_type:complete
MAFIKSTSTLSSNAVSVPNLTGGDNGKVVRISGSNTAVNATNTDTATQLMAVLVKIGDVYYASGTVSGFTGLTPGAPYFLGLNGDMVSSPPTPTSTTRSLIIGFALNTTDIIFNPGIPISGS